MKKIYFVLSMMLSVILFSCNDYDMSQDMLIVQNETGIAQSDGKAWTDFYASFNELNEETLRNVQLDGTRSIWKKIYERIKKFVKTDCEVAQCVKAGTNASELAADLSGVVASIADIFSYEQSVETILQDRQNNCSGFVLPKSVLEGTIYASASTATAVDSIGYIHNKLIMSSFNENPARFYTNYIHTDSMINSLCKYYAEEKNLAQGSVYKQIIKDKNFVKVRNSIENVIVCDTAINAAHNAMVALNSNCEAYLEATSDFVDMITNLDSDSKVNVYTKQVILTIENSDLSHQDKDIMKSGILVARASYKLWKAYMAMVE